MFFVYILQSETTGKYYIRQTNNLEQRLLRHNTHPDSYTKNKGPWRVVYSEECGTRSEAMRREKQIKSYKGGDVFKSLIA